MTTPMIDFQELIEKSTDGDWLREMISFAAQRLMDIEVEGLCGASFGERSEERVNHRNGYRDRSIGVGPPIEGRPAPAASI